MQFKMINPDVHTKNIIKALWRGHDFKVKNKHWICEVEVHIT